MDGLILSRRTTRTPAGVAARLRHHSPRDGGHTERSDCPCGCCWRRSIPRLRNRRSRKPRSPEPTCGRSAARSRRLSDRVGPSIVQVFAVGYAPPSDAERGTVAARASSGAPVRASSSIPSGYIVTNAHVVQGAYKVQVQLPAPRRGASRSIVRSTPPRHRRADRRHRRGDGPGRREGRRAGAAGPGACRFRLGPARTAGARVRQPARSGQLGDAGRRQRRRAAARTRRSDGLHPDRRVHQSGQQRGAAGGYGWARSWGSTL